MSEGNLDGIVAAASAIAIVGSGLVYGISDALDTPLPGREYVFGCALFGAYDAGRSMGLPDNDPSRGSGVVYAVAGGAAEGVSYLIGLGIGHLLKNT